jgi:hydroxymethylpyrimidine kinase/phosphomethylpyrimidine kinase
MISTSGSQLLPEDAVQNLCGKLLPMTTVLTPNMPEAKLLLQHAGVKINDPKNLDDVVQLAKEIQKLGPNNVLLKGGHLPLTADRQIPTRPEEASIVIDVLWDGSDVTLFQSDFIQSKNTHGTGCSLASAITANLVNGMDISQAVQAARWFVEAGIKTSVGMGRGNGPINHFHSVYSLPFAP